jgi:hypothetical protein
MTANGHNVRVSKDTHSLLFLAMNRLSQECGMRITMGKVVELLVQTLLTDKAGKVDLSSIRMLLKESFTRMDFAEKLKEGLAT